MFTMRLVGRTWRASGGVWKGHLVSAGDDYHLYFDRISWNKSGFCQKCCWKWEGPQCLALHAKLPVIARFQVRDRFSGFISVQKCHFFVTFWPNSSMFRDITYLTGCSYCKKKYYLSVYLLVYSVLLGTLSFCLVFFRAICFFVLVGQFGPLRPTPLSNPTPFWKSVPDSNCFTSSAIGDHSHSQVDLAWVEVWWGADGIVAWLQQGQLGKEKRTGHLQRRKLL